MIQTGYTAGALSRPSFNWVRNLRRKLTPEQLASSDYATSCLFAAGWNIIRASLPHEVSDDWVTFLRTHGLPAMDAGVGMSGIDASNPPLEERENQAKSLLKVEACGRANAEGRRCGKVRVRCPVTGSVFYESSRGLAALRFARGGEMGERENFTKELRGLRELRRTL
ncbi:hypothetical protein NUW54_g14044 [Trametes sanguinea]|uniref:Uncharacterized protein n=1 Tax=Trametes sanguinea TaxID=158606 RepID=A0ACC1MFB7_9APHY|nr:hypothetical protein NUW54_g14044 [Trametes sanguinea]